MQNETRAAGHGRMEDRSWLFQSAAESQLKFASAAKAGLKKLRSGWAEAQPSWKTRFIARRKIADDSNLNSDCHNTELHKTESAFPAPLRTGSKSRSGQTTATVATRVQLCSLGQVTQS